MSEKGAGKLYLHIGRHKCGTSTLQHFLCGSETELAAHGFVYPVALRTPVAHHPLAHFYNPRAGQPGDNDAEAAAAVHAFWQDVKAAPKSIVSSEALQNLDPATLVRDLADFDLTIIVYLREPLDYLLSAYAQRVKGGGGTETLDAFIDRFRPDYRDFLMRWQAAFPAAELKVRAFERSGLVGQDIRRDFLHCLGLTAAEAETFSYPDTDSNVSIGGPLLEFMRRINLRGRPDGLLHHSLYQAVQKLAALYPEYRTRPVVPARLQEEIRDRNAASLGWLAGTYFGGLSPFPEKTFPEGEIDHGLSCESCDLIWQRLEENEPSVAEDLRLHVASGGPLSD
ncbi:hypothetical protein [Kordiimonas marina]|uniref:hypothetical protein n=1 Tax=Kordiimonas marina TaxID=2872312 RepID=UPI001FF2910C|nr:hypothetical protein [Kordiimonas marina]MCJ9430780.1 hypothetical protein [Kordiimonas marina]